MISNRAGLKIVDADKVERRRARRWKVFKKAYLVLGSGLVPCAIFDITDNGARIQIPSNTVLRDTFRIFILGDEVMASARRVWENADQIGVEFIEKHAQHPPSAHW